MISIQECKQFVILHAKILGVEKEAKLLLDSIDETSEHSFCEWGDIFLNEGLKQEKSGNIDKALGLYNIARFPFPSAESQREAYRKYISLFNKQYISQGFLKRYKTEDGKFVFYYKEGSSLPNELVIFCGGIISLKEQWVRALELIQGFGVSVILSEMPGVGENELAYDSSCFDFFTKILDTMKIPTGASCHIVAMSFSGYIALQNSCTDQRINSITMVGSPVDSIYHTNLYFDLIPGITKKTIMYNINKGIYDINSDNDLFMFIDYHFPSVDSIRKNIIIFYLQSKYDEIIPSVEATYLQSICNNFFLFSLPDVHGSPNFHKTAFLFVIWSILKSIKKRFFMRCIIVSVIKISKQLGSILATTDYIAKIWR